MIRTRAAGMGALVVALAVAAVAAGSAAAAMQTPNLRVHARLAPVGGTTPSGRFDGLLARGIASGSQPMAVPRARLRWQLAWNASLPAFRGPATVSLRINAGGGAARVVRVLCTNCGSSAAGAVTLTASEVFRIARWGGVVTVRAPSARLRGRLRVLYGVKPG